MNSRIMYPTHQCFDDAMEWMEFVAQRCSDNGILPNMVLVHAICEGTYEGVQYSHAWVEDHCLNVVIAAGILDGVKVYYFADKDKWYAARRVKEKTLYSFRQTAERNLATGHVGPWEEKYGELCSSQTTVVGEGMMDIKLLGPLPTRKETT